MLLDVRSGRIEIEADGLPEFSAACDAAVKHCSEASVIDDLKGHIADLNAYIRELAAEKYLLARRLRAARKLTPAHPTHQSR